MKINKLVKIFVTLTAVAIVFGAYASSSYGQETSTTDDTAPANPLPPTAYVNAGKGYEIRGNIVLIEPGGLSSGSIALGNGALLNNTGSNNTASGISALFSNTTGSFNTASGESALYFNTIGNTDTASGFIALGGNTTGNANAAFGYAALSSNTTGDNNIAIGVNAAANVSGGNGNNIEIGSTGASADSGTIRIGCTSSCPDPYPPQTSFFAGGIAGVMLPTANEPLVCIDPPTGQLGTQNCAANGAPFPQQELINQKQQVQIETLQRQNEDLQQRVSRLEALIAKK